MPKILSNRQPKVNIGIRNYTNNKKILDVIGNAKISGITSVTSLDVYGSVSAANTTGNNGQFLQSTGVGVTWGSLGNSLPTLRNSSTFVATSNQTTFNVNYNVGFVDIFINGVRLTSDEFTASNGNTISVNESCYGGETVDVISYNTVSAGNNLVNHVQAPQTSNSSGSAGQTANDSSYFYVCVSPNTWKRVNLDNW